MGKSIPAAAAAVVFIAITSGCSRNNLLPTVPSTTAMTAPSYAVSVIIDDCNDNDGVNYWGGDWYTYDDTKNGNNGHSIVIPSNGSLFTMSYADASDPDMPYAARMQGKLRLNYAYPLIGMGTNLSPTGEPKDLTKYSGFKFLAKKGTADKVGMYRVAFKSANITDPSKYQYYGYAFSPGNDWKEYKVYFSSAQFTAINYSYGIKPKAESLAGVQAIQFQTGTNTITSELPADLWVDKVELFKE